MTKANILVVEGEQGAAQDLESRVKFAGYRVVGCASSGKEAVQMAAHFNLDVILMGSDINGEMDAAAAVEEIKSQYDVSVVFLTTSSIQDLEENVSLTGNHEILQKPFRDNELNYAIKTALYRREMERKLAEYKERTQALMAEKDTENNSDMLQEEVAGIEDVLAGVRVRCYESLGLSRVLKVACEETAGVLGIPAVSIMVYDENDEMLNLSKSYGLPTEFRLRHKPVMKADFEALLKQVSPVAIILNGDDEPCLTNAPLYRAMGISTVIVSAMCVSDQLVGSLSVFIFDNGHDFAYDDLGTLQKLADLVALPIANAREVDETQQMLDQLELACDAGMVLNSLNDPRILLESLLQIVMATLGADRVTFYRYESEDDLVTGVGLDAGVRVQHEVARAGSIVFDMGLGHPSDVLAGLQVSRIELGDERDFAGWVATNLAPLYAADLHTDSHFGVNEAEMRSAFGVPIEWNKQLRGVLVVMCEFANAFDTKKQLLLRRLANQTAVAITNADLITQLRRQGLSNESKNRVFSVLLAAKDLDELAPIFLNELLAVLEAPVGGVWIYDAGEDVMVQLAVRGLQSERKRYGKQDNLIWQVYTQRKMCLSEEFRYDIYAGDDLQGMFPEEVGGVLFPLIDGNEFIGVCLVGVKQPRTLSPEELQLLAEIAPAASNAICRRMQLANTKRRFDQAQGLQAIDQAISASMDLRFILKVILDQVVELLRIDAADVLLLNPHAQTLEFAAGQGFQTAALQHTHLKLGQGRAGMAALERRIVHVPNLLDNQSGFQRAPLLANERFIAYYGIPLVSKGQVVGVLELFHRAPHESDLEWRKFLEAIATQAAIAIDNVRLFEDLQRTNDELMLAYDTTLEGWSRALDLHDRTPRKDIDRVTDMATRLARELGVTDYDEIHIRRGAILHDIGKMGVPEDILNKKGPLTDEEWGIMRRHPVYAYELLSSISYLRPALDIPYCHHERWDGSGYPVGLIGDQIPLSARIFAIVDVWDALLSERPYRQAWKEDQVLAYIKEQAGTQFDPVAVDAFINMIG